MKIIDEYRQNLVAELIENSANIDLLVVKSRQVSVEMKYSIDQTLDEMACSYSKPMTTIYI